MKDLKLQNSPLFGLIEETIYSWEGKEENSEVGDIIAQIYGGVLSSFWENLERVCVTHVDVNEADEKELTGVSGLLQVLKNSSTSFKKNKKKKARIRFTDEEESDLLKPEFPESSTASLPLNETASHPLTSMRQARLQDLVCKLAELSMIYIEQGSSQHLKFLAALLSTFSSIGVFQVLLEHGNDHDPKLQTNPAVLFLHQKLRGWLQKCQKEEADFLVDILYSVLLCCWDTLERKHLMDDLTKVITVVGFWVFLKEKSR